MAGSSGIELVGEGRCGGTSNEERARGAWSEPNAGSGTGSFLLLMRPLVPGGEMRRDETSVAVAVAVAVAAAGDDEVLEWPDTRAGRVGYGTMHSGMGEGRGAAPKPTPTPTPTSQEDRDGCLL